MRCAGRVVRLRGERCSCAHLRCATEVVEGNNAGNKAGERCGDLRVLSVGKVRGSVDTVDVEAGAKCGGDLRG